jgi:hypothetical protein
MFNYVRNLILGISTESYNKRFAYQLNKVVKGILVYFISENAAFDIVGECIQFKDSSFGRNRSARSMAFAIPEKINIISQKNCND